MFNFLKKKSEPTQETTEPSSTPIPEKTPGFFSRLYEGLKKTRQRLGIGLKQLLTGRAHIDDALIEEIETLLLSADVGVSTTQHLIQKLKKMPASDANSSQDAVLNYLKICLLELLNQTPSHSLEFTDKPFVILLLGINGAGKTTSIGKLAHYFMSLNKKVLLAAGDTFRAAAIEQLSVWAERNNIPCIAQSQGADTAAVIFDAVQSARARGIDIVLADTAGRLHTQQHLMQELEKVKRVLGRLDPKMPHEAWIVLDATIGQNAIQQVKQFGQTIGLTGIIMTKLDGTAKGGALFGIAQETRLPILFAGVGEGIDDLRPFCPKTFVDALFSE